MNVFVGVKRFGYIQKTAIFVDEKCNNALLAIFTSAPLI